MARSSRQAQILRNKRNVQRVRTSETDNSVTPDLSIADHYNFTALSTSLSINAPVGNPRDHDRLVFRIKDWGLPQSLVWSGSYASEKSGSLPVDTSNGTLFLEFQYDTASDTWLAVKNLVF